MKIAIIDDETFWRECAENIVRQYYGDVKIDIDVFESGAKYLETREFYDITLVDIEMPVIDGFETISKAREYNREGLFIILTTHIELSRRGYFVNAFRYVDKTNIKAEINEAIKSAEILFGRNEKVYVNVIGEGQRELVLKNILYIETEKHYRLVHTTNGIVRCSNSMEDIEDILGGKWFFRCHNAYIVNLDEITKIEDTMIYMSNGNNIDVSVRKLPSFRKAYVNRQFECANA